MRPLAVALLAVVTAAPCLAKASSLTAELDANLWSSDKSALVAIMKAHPSPADQQEIIEWLQRKIDAGQAPDRLVPAIIFVSAKSGDGPDTLKYVDYYRALLLIDGSICPDANSGSAVFEASIFMFAPVVKRFTSLTSEQRQQAVEKAIKLEAATSSTRRVDPTLCGSYGLHRYLKDSGTKDSQEPPTTGSPKAGTRYADYPAWREQRTKALPQLAQTLLMLTR